MQKTCIFFKKGFAFSLFLKVRVFGTQKCQVIALFSGVLVTIWH